VTDYPEGDGARGFALKVILGWTLALACTTSTHGGPLEQFDWLAGTWTRESASATVYESWRVLSERTMEGQSHVVLKTTGERRLAESLLLVEMGGEIYYIPRPPENPYPVTFRLTSHDDGVAVFENPQHDFPTKIVYRRNDDGSMTASIEGPTERPGEPGRIDFHFTRED